MRGFFCSGHTDYASGHSDSHEHHRHRGGHHQSHGHDDASHNSGSSSANNALGQGTYPVALPSSLEKRYPGPVVGTAVLDKHTMSVEEAAAVFEMVTPENTPLVKTHVKARFEAAVEELLEQRRQLRETSAPPTATEADSAALTGAQSDALTLGNTFDHFLTPDPAFNSFRKSKSHHRRTVLAEGGYLLFSDRFMSSHPTSCITGVTNELHMAAPESEITPHDPPTGPDADKQRLQEVKAYIRQAEHEYRPIFRRRNSAMVYGRGEYMHTTNPIVRRESSTCTFAPPAAASSSVSSAPLVTAIVPPMKTPSTIRVSSAPDLQRKVK